MGPKTKDFGTSLIVQAPPDEECGPAMLRCTAMQRMFVVALCLIPDTTNETAAARIAGYSQPKSDSSALMRNPKVLAAIREEADKRVRGGALIGAKALIEIASDPMNKNRFQAAQALLDRAGLQVVAKQEILVEHTDNRSNEELISFIKTMAVKHGLDPKVLLGENAIEGDFVEVSATAIPTTESPDDAFTLSPEDFGGAETPGH